MGEWSEYRTTFVDQGVMQIWQLDAVHTRKVRPLRLAVRLTMTVHDDAETLCIKVAKNIWRTPFRRKPFDIGEFWRDVLDNRDWVLDQHRSMT